MGVGRAYTHRRRIKTSVRRPRRREELGAAERPHLPSQRVGRYRGRASGTEAGLLFSFASSLSVASIFGCAAWARTVVAGLSLLNAPDAAAPRAIATLTAMMICFFIAVGSGNDQRTLRVRQAIGQSHERALGVGKAVGQSHERTFGMREAISQCHQRTLRV